MDDEAAAADPAPYVLFVGRLIQRKGLDVLLRAIAGVTPPLRLVVIGDGPERDAMQALASAQGLDDRVQWLGRRSNTEARLWMAQALALLVPSEFEQWGLVVNEAWMAPTLVLGSDTVGALRAAYKNEMHWMLMPAGDVVAWQRALSCLLALRPEERAVLMDETRRLAEKYYGSIPARALPVRKPRPEPQQKGVRRVDYKAPAEQAYVLMAFKVPDLGSLDAPRAGDQDALALLMLSGVLSGYDGARLDRRLTQGDKRVADATFSGANVVNRGPATFVLGGIPANGHSAKEVEDALRAEVARVAQEGVSDAELARVKTQWTASTVYERDSVFGQANDLGSNWVQGLPLDANDKLLALLKAITPAQVQAVAAGISAMTSSPWPRWCRSPCRMPTGRRSGAQAMPAPMARCIDYQNP